MDLNLHLNLNVGILLAGGTSSRFNLSLNENKISKQLYLLGDKPLINYSIDSFLELEDINLNYLLIIVNSEIKEEIEKIIEKETKIIIIVLVNDFNDRLESINTGLQYINDYIYDFNPSKINIIIHDSARPFITQKHLKTLIDFNQNNQNIVYSQYCMKLTNGLINLENNEVLDRNKYLELCSPISIDFKTCYDIFENYMKKDENNQREFYEFIPVLNILNLEYKLIEGHFKDLRKITTRQDIF
jgi:2-C-methyl-D-erythritol 4-phosphate cytidylyltransferase